MSHRWLEALEPQARAEAEALIERLRSLGCPEPEAWARREVGHYGPQVSRWVLLRLLWTEAIDAWRDSVLWVENLVEDSRGSPDSPFAEAGRAVARLQALGAKSADLALVARFVAYETAFSVVHSLDEGYDPAHEGQLPGWGLVERDPLGHLTGRTMTHLHEDLPKAEP